MSVYVMKCEEVKNHNSADSLKVYKFSCGENQYFQIIANLDNTCNVGESAIIALDGSILKDNSEILTQRIRNTVSHGMMLGVTDKPVGTDLTEEYCISSIDKKFFKWTSIGSLFNIRKNIAGNERTINYKYKIKLDGTNAGVVLKSSGNIYPQSRNRVINILDDNIGFAAFVEENKEYFTLVRENANKLGINDDIILFGEWAGKGIQKRTSISNINKKIFAIFAIRIQSKLPVLETSPEEINKICLPDNDNVYVLPWLGEISLNFANELELQTSANILNQVVADIEKYNPWVKDNFGIEGLGEGIVCYPIIDNKTKISTFEYSEFVFKAKGEEHKVVKTKKSVQINPEKASSIDNFVNLFCTENRFEQIAKNVGEINIKNLGNFIKEFNQDVKKESEEELQESGLDWKSISKALTTASRLWWLDKIQKQN